MKLLKLLYQILKEQDEEELKPIDPTGQGTIKDVPELEPEQPEEEINKNISPIDAKNLIKSTKGKFFTVWFTKKDNTLREMNARLGVKAYLKGGELPYNPEEKGLIPVYDMQKRAYRMINWTTIKKLRIGNNEYNVNSSLSEITIKPTKTYNIQPKPGESLKDFTKRVSNHFIGNSIEGTFTHIDKTVNGYSSKLTELYGLPDENYYTLRNPDFWNKYFHNINYLIDFFSLPQWKSLIQIKIFDNTRNDVARGGKTVRFLTKEHPKNVILKPLNN